MNIEEAIKELRKDTEHPTAKYLPELMKAIQLGIEALEQRRELKDIVSLLPFRPSILDLALINQLVDKVRQLLPSETE